MPDRITLSTVDDVVIVGDWVPSPRMIGVVILLHMMPETRSSWFQVQMALSRKGFASLAIDLRGHGESIVTLDGNTLDYRQFDADDHLGSLDDVRAALDWVRKRGIEDARIVMCGASIGANISLSILTEEPHLAGAILLSPGAEYHGFNGAEDVKYAMESHQLVIVSAEDDPESFAASKKMYADASCEKKTFIPYPQGGHGTKLLAADPMLVEKIADWAVGMVSG